MVFSFTHSSDSNRLRFYATPIGTTKAINLILYKLIPSKLCSKKYLKTYNGGYLLCLPYTSLRNITLMVSTVLIGIAPQPYGTI